VNHAPSEPGDLRSSVEGGAIMKAALIILAGILLLCAAV